MQLSSRPGKLVLPFANAGNKNEIPVSSQVGITPGAASLADGFPPLTMTPVAAGGVPPSGLDMNGILFELSDVVRWANAGGGYPYDADFVGDTNVDGYPKGARVLRSDGLGYWFNTVDNNTTDPEAAGADVAGWVPDFTDGVAAVAMASANVTLTPSQYGKSVIVITGTLTSNLNLIFPAIVKEWSVINNTTGAFTITCKTASGTGVAVSAASKVTGDGVNIFNSLGFLQSGLNATPRNLQDKARELKSIADYVTPALADALATTLFVAAATASTVANGAALNSLYWGPEQVTTADGNKRGKWFSQVKARPATLGNHNSIDTAFNGDLSKSIFQIEHRITGAATLGQPATGYLYTPECSPLYLNMFNSSGHNQSLSGNDGRTAAVAAHIQLANAGQGDMMGLFVSGVVVGTKAGSTHWLANPAISAIACTFGAGADGVYLNPLEFLLKDNGFDAACVGPVLNFDRTNATGAKSAYWGGMRMQSLGAADVDNALAITGKWKVGIDFAMSTTDFGANAAAVSLKSGQRIYFNNTAVASGSLNQDWRTTVFNQDYISHSGIAISIVNENNPSFTCSKNQITVSTVNGISLASTGTYRIGANQVVGPRNTGWTAMTGTPNNNAAYATSTVTLPELASRVMSIQLALTGHGLLGA